MRDGKSDTPCSNVIYMENQLSKKIKYKNTKKTKYTKKKRNIEKVLERLNAITCKMVLHNNSNSNSSTHRERETWFSFKGNIGNIYYMHFIDIYVV